MHVDYATLNTAESTQVIDKLFIRFISVLYFVVSFSSVWFAYCRLSAGTQRFCQV